MFGVVHTRTNTCGFAGSFAETRNWVRVDWSVGRGVRVRTELLRKPSGASLRLRDGHIDGMARQKSDEGWNAIGYQSHGEARMQSEQTDNKTE